MSTTVISRSDSSPVLEPCEHVFDLMTLFVLGFTELSGRCPAFARRDTGRDAFGLESASVFITVIALVSDHDGAALLRQSRIEYLRPDMVTDLPGGERHQNGTPPPIDHCMQFGVQPAFRAPDMAGNIPFLSRLDAVRCALRWEASIINVSGGPSSAAK